jgi:hypothetical protein
VKTCPQGRSAQKAEKGAAWQVAGKLPALRRGKLRDVSPLTLRFNRDDGKPARVPPPQAFNKERVDHELRQVEDHHQHYR